MSPPRRIAPSRLTGLRGSVPRWFISCRNAGPTFCVLPSFLRPLLLRFSRRPTSFLPFFLRPLPFPRLHPPPGVVYSNGGGYFTQSTVAQDFHQIPVLDALPSSPSQISYPRASARIRISFYIANLRFEGEKQLTLCTPVSLRRTSNS